MLMLNINKLFFLDDKKNCKALIVSEIGKSKDSVSGKLYSSIIKVGVPNIKSPTPNIDWNNINIKIINGSIESVIYIGNIVLEVLQELQILNPVKIKFWETLKSSFIHSSQKLSNSRISSSLIIWSS